MKSIAATLDELPGAAWIALALVGFVVWWPLGLAILIYTIWSGKMRCCGMGFGARNEEAERAAETRRDQPPMSGNRSFDEYRADTLRRLEQEQREFHDFLARLRMAKDKAEFDQFMTERRTRAESSPPQASA